MVVRRERVGRIGGREGDHVVHRTDAGAAVVAGPGVVGDSVRLRKVAEHAHRERVAEDIKEEQD